MWFPQILTSQPFEAPLDLLLVGDLEEAVFILKALSLSLLVTTVTKILVSFPFLRLFTFLYFKRDLSLMIKSPDFLELDFPLSNYRQIPNIVLSSNQNSCLACIFRYSMAMSFHLISRFFDYLFPSSLNLKKQNSILI